MADDKKPDPSLDDWDNLPLDPAADDWDDIPAASADSAKADLPKVDLTEAGEAAGEDDFDDPPPVPSAPAANDGPPPGPFDAFLSGSAAEDDDFDDPPPSSVPPADGAEPADGPPPGPFDAFLGSRAESTDDFDAPSAAPFEIPVEVPVGPSVELEDEAVNDAPGGDVSADIDAAFNTLTPQEPPPAAAQKVELDIDGIFLENLDTPHPEQPKPEPASEPEAPAEPEKAPAPAGPDLSEEVAVRRKVPLVKLLILVLPSLLVLSGLSFGVYRLFIYKPPPPPKPLVIDATVPFREPEPGELPLLPFYINFAGEPETIVEMSVMLYYNDAPDKDLIAANLPAVREVIFRITQSKGSQVVTSGEIQRTLRRELAQAANAALGAEAVSYVQLTQFRILH